MGPVTLGSPVRRERLLALAILALLAPLAIAQAGAIQQRIDSAPAGSTLAIPAGSYHEAIAVAKPLTIEGADRQTFLSAPGATLVRLDANDTAFRFIELDQGAIGVEVTPGHRATIGPLIVQPQIPVGLKLDAGSILLLRNDPSIPISIAQAPDARFFWTQARFANARDAWTGFAIPNITATLLDPTNATLAIESVAAPIDIPVKERDAATGAQRTVATGYAMRFHAEGYDDVTIPIEQVGAAPLAMSQSAPPPPDPSPVNATADPAQDPAATSDTTPPAGSASSPASSSTSTPTPTLTPTAIPPAADDPLETASVHEPSAPTLSTEQAVAVATATAVVAGSAGGAVLVLRSERRLLKWLWALAPLYTRLRRGALLDQPTRERIHAHIAEHPGIRYRELQRAVALPNGALAHHLQILLKERLIVQLDEGRSVRFHLPGERPDAPVDTSERVLAFVRAHPGATGNDIAKAIDMKPSLVGYHLQRLEENARIRRERDGARVRAFPLDP